MRLWHESLLSRLPRQQLLGQHRECCALRGKGWGKPHSVINYIFKYDLAKLYEYHIKVMEEMINRGYNVTEEWLDSNYRGKLLGYDYSWDYSPIDYSNKLVYNEHENSYLIECKLNLISKGICV